MKDWLLKEKDGPKWAVIKPGRGSLLHWVFVKGFSNRTHKETYQTTAEGGGCWFGSEEQVALHVVSGDDQALTAAYAEYCSQNP